jgi:hypothetical protein
MIRCRRRKNDGKEMANRRKNVPQRLKPTMICAVCGMAEAMPFQSSFAVRLKPCLFKAALRYG